MSMRYLSLFFLIFLLAGCARFATPVPEATPTPTAVAVPTFTPTVVANDAGEAAAQSEEATPVEEATSAPVTDEDPDETDESVAPTKSALASLLPTVTPVVPADGGESAEEAESEDDDTVDPEPAADADAPNLTVSGEIVNVRQGPGVEYPTVGTAEAGETFALTGRNEAADWWQVCCFADEPGWLYGPLVDVQAGDAVAVAADISPAPTATPAPVAVEEAAPEVAPTAAPVEEAATVVYDAHSGTEGSFDPAAQYHVVGYRAIGYGENNGGIFNNGGQHIIFINVIDADGAGISGAVVKNAINDNIHIVTGAKGPGRNEFEMFWDPYKLYVAEDPSGPVTSQITNQMNTVHPHIPDIVGRLGPIEEELSICPTVDVRCDPPFHHAHWSYEVTFQKVN